MVVCEFDLGGVELVGLSHCAVVDCVSDFRSGEPIVEVRNLKKTYGGRFFGSHRNVQALRGITLDARPGEVFGLLGPNGAGKTTLIKTLLGVIQPSSGTAALFGIPVGSASARMRVGYLPESLRVDKHHTARSALRYYGRLSRMDSKSIRIRSDELLELVGLRERDNESVRRFSKGMYQRLGLAQALMHDPDLLLLDEPTDGLDPVGRNDVRQVIDRLRGLGKTIFLNSHILQEVELVCTRVAIMAKGKVLANALLSEMRLQSSTQEQLEMDVIAPPELNAEMATCKKSIEECFRDSSSSRESAHDSLAESIVRLEGSMGTYCVRLASMDQPTVDQIVDRLRSAGFSVARLQRKGPSLEDTFIKLVRAAEEQSE